MEHTGIFGPGKGLERPGETIKKVVAGNADAVMTTFGIASHFVSELAPVGLILRSDGAATKLGEDVSAPVWFGVEEAIRIGADALCLSAYPGDHKEMDTLNNIAEVARQARYWGLAVQAEMVPGGMGSGPEMRTVENIAHAARLGLELGADWVKVPYVEGFKKVVEVCFKPVVIMGGKKRSNDLDILTEMKAAMDAGAAGGTIGRNIFESDDPEAMTAALVAIVHDGVSVDQAVKIAKGK